MMTKKALHYKDICLLPQYSDLKTRKDADVSVNFLGFKFRLPIIPSNMVCVIDEKRAEWMSDNNYFYVMHRFGIDNYEFVKKSQGWANVSISVGVQESDRQSLLKMKNDKVYPDFITIDIAHGDSILMKEMIEFIKGLNFPSKIIAGNVCTIDGYNNLMNWGADAVKVGIGGGAACSTKNKTGFTMPMYTCIKEICDSENYEVPVIADGGVREHADIVKAIHAGANMVMAGGLFSRLIDSPAEVVNGHKVYFGSASQYNKGEYRNVEGIKRTFELDTMTYSDKLMEIEQDLQSAVSYAGGKVLQDIQKVIAIKVSHWEV
jgi:GMP reductase